MPIPPRLPLHVSSILLLLILSACQTSSSTTITKSSDSAEPLRLPVVAVQSSDLSTVVSMPGTISALPDESVKVSPTVAGTILAIPVTPGEYVHRGQIIAQLDDRQLKAQLNQAVATLQGAQESVAQAKANLQLANSDLQSYGQLYKAGAISQENFLTYNNKAAVAQSQLNGANAQVQQDQAARTQALDQLKYTKVHSPISGIVASRLLQVGDTAAGATASPSTPIMEIVNLDTVLVNANLPADQPAKIHVGEKAQIQSVATPGMTFDGIVSALAPVVDPRSNTLSVQIRTPNLEKKLKAGQVVTAAITTGIHQALTVPKTALVPSADNSGGQMVYTVEGGKAKPIEVKTGIERNGEVEILSGLKAGEMVVAKDAYGIPAGSRVQAVAEAKQ